MFFLQRLGPVHSFIAAMSISIVIHLGDDILIMELKKRLFALPLRDEGVELIVEFERIHRCST
jgi:hypothetical protein